jgi:hypothetical protein
MTGRDDEAWLDSLLQRQDPSSLAGTGFREQILRRLPPRERPWLRAFLLGLSCLLALALLLLSSDGPVLAAEGTGEPSFFIPCCLGTALLWYLADHQT